MSRSDLSDLLERYSRGETSPEENRRVEEWLSGHENKDNAWEAMTASGKKEWLDKLWTDIDASAHQPAKIISFPPKSRIWRAIASVAAILIISLGIWRFSQSAFNDPAPSGLISAITTSSEKKTVVLSDGSTIWLNTGSVLKYPEKFTNKTREVFLEGEAYFDIKHDADKTFIVHTGKILTTVIGTAFNIVAEEKDSAITVTVTRGKVKVSEGEKVLDFITPNQQISYNTQNHNFTKATVDAATAISWKSEDLLFDDITFGDAAEILSKRFGVNITFANDKIRNCRFSGTAISGKNIDEILMVLCAFNKAEFRHEPNGDIIIDGEGCI